MIEIWKPIDNYENYEISNFGNVVSVNYNKTGIRKCLKKCTNTFGYECVFLQKNGTRKIFQVHRLVAEAFVPNPNNYPQVNHIDENKRNNNMCNLEWCSRSYNMNYGTRNNRAAKMLSPIVYQYDKNGTLLKKWDSVVDAAETLHLNKNSITRNCRGERKSAYGYIWKYK